MRVFHSQSVVKTLTMAMLLNIIYIFITHSDQLDIKDRGDDGGGRGADNYFFYFNLDIFFIKLVRRDNIGYLARG